MKAHQASKCCVLTTKHNKNKKKIVLV